MLDITNLSNKPDKAEGFENKIPNTAGYTTTH